MEEGEDSDSEVEEILGFQQPPLIEQLKTILAEYPDDGQIIKELVQNAEDAGATEVKILYDGRTINADRIRKLPYRKFFKAPSLCFYNNAVFSEADWGGIRTIYSSIKKDQPLKVGRFGLGFKSVFHITDYVSIISGNKLLLMNPLEKRQNQECVVVKLNDLQKNKKLQTTDLLAALNGVFGFSEETLQTGIYNGTIFWFPLRAAQSELSDNLYEKGKVLDLFKSFKAEAVESLLFLKCLSRVELYCKSSETVFDLPNSQAFLTVELQDDTNVIKSEKRKFLQKIDDFKHQSPISDIVSFTHSKFTTVYRTTDCEEAQAEDVEWLVVNMYKTGQFTNKLKNLVDDKELSYSPYGGVAILLKDTGTDFKGHIFCFLPLPHERRSLTGLPVHVNGFFALSQNRRHLKWATADQEKLHTHRDKSIEWNECLVGEVLPDIYYHLLQEMIRMSQKRDNTKEAVSVVYRCFPDLSQVDSKWETLTKGLFQNLCDTECVFLRNRGKWVKFLNPLYTMFYGQAVTMETQDCVRNVLGRYIDEESTTVPDHVWKFLKTFSVPRDVSPTEVRRILKTNDVYKQAAPDEKLILLGYLLQDKEYELVKELELLPLEDKTFVAFQQRESPVYLCSEEEINLFPGLEDQFVSTKIPEHLRDLMKELAHLGMYHIKILKHEDIIKVLDDTIKFNFGSEYPVHLDFAKVDSKFAEWIKTVWVYIAQNIKSYGLAFDSLPLLPLLVEGEWDHETWKDSELYLYKLSQTFLLKSCIATDWISEHFYKAMDLFPITVLPSLPSWIDKQRLCGICESTESGIVQIFELLFDTNQKCIDDFNMQCVAQDREALVNCLARFSSPLPYKVAEFLKRLNFFEEKRHRNQKPSKYVSLSENNRIAKVYSEFPIVFPEPFIVPVSDNCVKLAASLGATMVDDVQMTTLVLKAIHKNSYEDTDVIKFMKWFLQRITNFSQKEEIVQLAKSIAFIQSTDDDSRLYKPSELFDPREEEIRLLFFEEHVFPQKQYETDSVLNAMQCLGLKNKNSVTPHDLLNTASILDLSYAENRVTPQILKKAYTLFQFLERQRDILSDDIISHINHFRCIPPLSERPKKYPPYLPWKGTDLTLCCPATLKAKIFTNTAGSVKPLIKASKQLGEIFSWNKAPTASVVIAQLQSIVTVYTSAAQKPDLLPFVSDIYKLLADKQSEEVRTAMLQINCVWWGDGFCHPKKIVIDQKTDDIDLRPYMHHLPEEFQPFKSFFGSIGCYQHQDTEVLLEVQNMVLNKYKECADKYKVSVSNLVSNDLQLIIRILQRLQRDNVTEASDRILIPIRTENEQTLILKPLTQCTFCDTKWLQDMVDEEDENIYYIHSAVPQSVAEGLGVKSLRQHMMSDAEALEEWGQEEPLTRRLHSLLEGYPDGLSVPKELIQNADDAGATKVCFILDERENLDCRTQLLDESMSEMQGPALLVYNNALFTNDDLQNITKLNGGTKETDATKIGKFGLGFCAVYNITDVPSFLSGHDVVIFDPHKKYLGNALPGNSPGLRINLKSMRNLKMMKRLHRQFKPFHGVLGCDISASQKAPFFNGTLFRLPLRTQTQADTSEIKKTCYSRDEAVELLKQLIKSLGNMLLFTQTVESIHVFHIPASCTDPSKAIMVCSATKELHQKCTESVLQTCSYRKINRLLKIDPFTLLQTFDIKVDCKDSSGLVGISKTSSNLRWLVSWATGNSESLVELCYSPVLKGALPLGSVALPVRVDETQFTVLSSLEEVPFSFYKTGHLFCFLPLPVELPLPVHINGNFAVTSDRRGLRTDTEDDKGLHDGNWNSVLLGDAIVQAFISLLECVHDSEKTHLALSSEYKFYQLWPKCSVPQNMTLFKQEFYQHIVTSNRPVFQSQGRWIGIRKCTFLDKRLAYDDKLGTIAMSGLLQFYSDPSSFVIDLPYEYFDEIEKIRGWTDSCRVITVYEYFKDIFLPNLTNSYWSTTGGVENRNELLLFCIEYSDSELDSLLESIACIPSSPNGKLIKPCDSVSPNGKVFNLFSLDDERFPVESFRETVILDKLKCLGMMENDLQPPVIIDRAKSIQDLTLSRKYNDATDRCKYLLKYLAESEELSGCITQDLQNIPFLPILVKPKSWPLPWKASENEQAKDRQVMFETPRNLFHSDCKELVACKNLILDERVLKVHSNIFKQVGVKSMTDITIDKVLEQLTAICAMPEIKGGFREERAIDKIVWEIYQYLEDKINEDEIFSKAIRSTLKDKPVIYLGNKFVNASKVAFTIGHDCLPELYEVGANRIRRFKRFLEVVGVKEKLEIGMVIGIVKTKQLEYGDKELNILEFKLIRNLLEYLTDLMSQSEITYDHLLSYGEDSIFAPDTDKILRPTYQLCFDDCDFVSTSSSMRFVHSDLSRTCSEKLGVYTKRRKCLEECSLEIPFEQKEDLVTRLKGLLDGYPCDTGIMKELIQNADDANATEIHFMIDFRKHPCERIFEESYSEFQGPAICVFNDSFFSKEDLTGIQNLGIGSKSTDPCKTGQYGVGFNAVYNLTDMPSFLTKGQGVDGGETLCIFDPLHRHCKRKIGTRYVDMQTFRKTFGDVLSGYNENVFFSGRNQGTVFRLPLRKAKSGISDIILSEDDVHSIFKDFKEDMFEIFLFLKSVSKITVSDITSGHLEILYSVSAFLSDSHKNLRSQFNAKRKEIGNSLKSNKLCILTVEPFQAEYEIHTEDNSGRKESWFVAQRIGFSVKNAPEVIEEAVRNQKIGLLPQGGVAVPVSPQQSFRPAVNGRAYCFLPLPGETGLPMHINGHFVLDHEARRCLWKEDKGYKSEWNKLLISDLIAPAYIEALNFVKSIFFSDSKKKQQRSISMVLADISSLEAVFPNSNKVSDKYWKHLVQSVFQRIVTDNELFFPVVLENIDGKCKSSVECRWNAFHQTGHMFSVIFTKTSINPSFDKPLQDLLKSIGMKISSTCLSVQQTMKDVGYEGRCLTPVAVIDFLQSYNCTAIDKVQLNGLPAAIQNTNIRNIDNAKLILMYCSQSNQVEEKLNNLPLMVTNDGALRCFDTDQKVYLSIFCDMFKHSARQFVHTELVASIHFLREKRFKHYLKELRLADFASLLQFEVNTYFSSTKDFCHWDPCSSVIPNKNWIGELWKYVANDFSLRCKSETVDVASYLKPLENWCLLPASLSESEYILMNINKANSLIFLETFKHPPALYAAIEKIGLPKFRREYVADENLEPITPCLVLATTPMLLLNCLNYFRGSLRRDQLRKVDCHEILRYFTDHLKEMQNSTSVQQLQNSLRALPFFLKTNGNHVTLDTDSTFVIIPDEMPLQGLDEWSQKTRTVLLSSSNELENLFSFLGITFADAIDFYTQYILENLVLLPDNSIIFHLKFVKDYLLQKQTFGNFTHRQSHLINILRNLDIIPDKNVRKKASDYCSPYHPVFCEMCSLEDFPPVRFREKKWKYFLELMGMKHVVTGRMFIQFAKEIATAGQNKITNTIKKKSKLVVQHLLKQQTDIAENELKEIATIKFIIPQLVNTKYTDIHKQYSDTESLICFSQSVSCEHYELSWTSMPLLPEWADPVHYTSNAQRDILRQVLNVYSKPPLDSIISHCQNVCDSLMDKSDGKAKRKLVCTWIASFMEKMYEALQSEALLTETAKQRLFYTPVVLFPEDVLLVQASQVIEEMTPDQEMKPYLLKAPRYFGKYYPLFRYLGATESPLFVHYIKVLSLIKEKVGSSTPNIAEWGVIQKAVDNMFKCLKEERVGTLDEELVLYLPTRGKTLKSTSEMIVVDNRSFERRLGKEQLNKMDIFIGFESLEIKDHTINSFQKLPDFIRPKYLSEIVREEVSETEIDFKLNSLLAVKLENFLRSPCFIEGLLRVCIQSKSDRNSPLTDTDRENIIAGLQNTKVLQVTGLNTYLRLLRNNVKIDESKRILNCYMPKPEIKNGVQHSCIYFQKRDEKTEEQWLESVDLDLIKCISQITSFKIREQHYIMKLVRKLNDPRSISLVLDEMKITAYELPAKSRASVFPDPGTYVPTELHHLLSCEFSSFEEHEYRCVALELEDKSVENDDIMESYEPVYIFVQIRRRIPTNEKESEFSHTYEVFTGTDTVILPAFKLYKVVRPDNESSKDVVDTVTTQASESLEKELYTVRHILRAAWTRPGEERKQIIKRLYLRWHPDKNIGNEEFCSKVFCYIKEVIIKLENGLLSDDEDSTDGQSQQSYAASSGFWNNRRPRRRRSRAYPDFSSSEYFNFWEKLNRRCKRHKAFSQAHYGSDFTGWAGGGYGTFFGASWPGHKAYHDPGEASRWLRQAKADLSYATRAIDIEGNPAAFNWICYLCHQATEKSLKAAWFAKDANKVERHSHNICSLADGLTGRVHGPVQELSALVGEHTKMRYPDVLERPKIPSTVYSRQQAERACELSREIVSVLGDEYSITGS